MLPVLAYLGIKTVSSSEVSDAKGRLAEAWRDFKTLDIDPFKKSVDSGAVLGTSAYATSSSTIGDVLGSPEQMKKLAPYVELRNTLVKNYAAFLAYKDRLDSVLDKPSPESAMSMLASLEDTYRSDRKKLAQVRKLVSVELPGGGPGPLVYVGGATGFGLLVYGIYRLIRRSTERS